ncbi:hypothetical protein KAU51_01785 [Candidatus Parcubacteria bacterium]|nr:hypothetical protein [Candidatus Parcubacteria bacterium]
MGEKEKIDVVIVWKKEKPEKKGESENTGISKTIKDISEEKLKSLLKSKKCNGFQVVWKWEKAGEKNV